jgi:hypothetical protein
MSTSIPGKFHRTAPASRCTSPVTMQMSTREKLCEDNLTHIRLVAYDVGTETANHHT